MSDVFKLITFFSGQMIRMVSDSLEFAGVRWWGASLFVVAVIAKYR